MMIRAVNTIISMSVTVNLGRPLHDGANDALLARSLIILCSTMHRESSYESLSEIASGNLLKVASMHAKGM